MTQENDILTYLKQGYSLTPIQALRLFQCFRLGARIFSLKKQGHAIKSELVRGENNKHYSKYSLDTISK